MLVSREAVLSLMPHQTRTKITREPTHAVMKKLERELPQTWSPSNAPGALAAGTWTNSSPLLSSKLAMVLPTHLQPQLHRHPTGHDNSCYG